jgi:hypothetical protein
MKALQDLIKTYPRWAAFAALAVAMVTVLLVASRDVALEPTQRLTLVVSTVALAGLSVWIIHWE